MRLLAAVATGSFVALATGALLGVLPRGRATHRRRVEVSARQQWLVQAGLAITPRRFALVSASVGLGAFLVLLLVTGVPMVSLAPAVLVAFVPRLYFGRVRERRMTEAQRAWPDGLRDLVASLTAGMSLGRAIEQLAQTGPPALREAFARFPSLSRTVGVVPALEVIKEELADATSDRVVEVLIVAHERGGSIVPEILRDLADATTRDVWALDEIQTQQLEQKINARAVFVLPWLVLVAITLRDGPFREFYLSAAGGLVVAVGAALSGLGIWIATRLAEETPEARVFGGATRRRVP